MLADDLLMLLHHPETGRLQVSSAKADAALGGALLVELTERRRIELSERHGVTKNRTVAVLDPSSTGDDILDGALQRIPVRRPARAQVVVSKIAKGVRGRLLERLTVHGALRSRPARLGGTIPARAWPTADAPDTEERRRELHRVLIGERAPTQQEAVIISLLHAVRGTAKVLGREELHRRELNRRAKVIAKDDAAGAAVRRALNAAAF